MDKLKLLLARRFYLLISIEMVFLFALFYVEQALIQVSGPGYDIDDMRDVIVGGIFWYIILFTVVCYLLLFMPREDRPTLWVLIVAVAINSLFSCIIFMMALMTGAIF